MPEDQSPFGTFKPFAEHAERAFASDRGQVDVNSALVFLDTNVLLAPYRTSTAALGEIKRIFENLRRADRLIIPGQVAREFARNRPTLIASLYKLVRDARSVSLNGRYEPPPVVRELPQHKRAVDELEKAQAALRSYRSAIEELGNMVAGWERADPVLDVYQTMFDSAAIRELSLPPAKLEAIRIARYSAQVPPGYKDKGKDDGGGGDLTIWLTILEVAGAAGRDAIFVSEETKADWFHRADNEPVFLRYELAHEFAAATSGRRVGHMTLASLLDQLGATQSVVKEVREQERVPWWTQFADSAVEETVLARLGEVVGADAMVSKNAGFPDIILDLSTGRLGVELTRARGASYRATSEPLSRAAALVSQGEFSEVAVVFLTSDTQTARALEDHFAEESFLGRGVSAIVVHGSGPGLRTIVNLSTHAILQKAFPPEGSGGLLT